MADDFYIVDGKVPFLGDPVVSVVSSVGDAFGYITKTYVEGGTYAEEKLLLVDETGNTIYRVDIGGRPWTADTIATDEAAGDIVAVAGAGGGSMTATQIRNSLATLTGVNRLGSDSINEDTNRSFLTDAQASAITANSAKNSYPSADATKVTNISITQAVDLDQLETDSHTHANKAVLDGTTASFTTADESKLDGVASGATVNDTDANLKNRANHTGSQAISTVTSLQTELDSKLNESELSTETDVGINGTTLDVSSRHKLRFKATYTSSQTLTLSNVTNLVEFSAQLTNTNANVLTFSGVTLYFKADDLPDGVSFATNALTFPADTAIKYNLVGVLFDGTFDCKIEIR